MKRNLNPIYAAILLLILASLACQSTASSKTTEIATNTPPQTIVPNTTQPENIAPKLPEPILPSGASGLACFGLQEGGLSCIGEDGWKTYTNKNSSLPNNYIADATSCPNGRIALAHYDGISLFDGKNWEHIAKSNSYSSAEGIACAADGSIWVAHFKGISRYHKGNWKTYAASKLATGVSANDLVYDIAVGPDNKVWAVTSRSVVQFNDEKWKIYQKGNGFEEDLFFTTLTIDSMGRPWAGYSAGAAVYESGEWKFITKIDRDSLRSMRFDAKGQLWLATLSKGVNVFNGNTWANHTRISEALSSDHVNDIAADRLGRVWLATSYGLTVFDGTTWQTYRLENSDLGDNDIKFAVVINDGPTLPALVEKEKASLMGILNDADNKPLGRKRVEICVETLSLISKGETPCTDQPFTLSTQTDEKGAFVFENIPAGYYLIVAETGTSWSQLTNQFGIGAERTLVQAGEKHDLGTLTLEKKK